MEIKITGKVATFGGPGDESGFEKDVAFVAPHEDPEQIIGLKDFFLPSQPEGTTGTRARLNPDTYYVACRWNYDEHSIGALRNMLIAVRDPRSGRSGMAKPIDWGPEISSGRVALISPGLASYLEISTDDVVEITIPTATVDLHGGAVAIVRSIEYTYIQAKNYLTGRSRPVQNIILHSTSGTEAEDIHALTKGINSVHWYITKDGRYFQFVDNADTALHVGKAASTLYSNAATIGIELEHLDAPSGKFDDEEWPEAQVQAVADLCAFLCHRYGLSSPNILTHSYVAEPRGRVNDPPAFPLKKFQELVKKSMTYTWITQSVGEVASSVR